MGNKYILRALSALALIISFLIWPAKSASFDSIANVIKTFTGIALVLLAGFLWHSSRPKS
jgi:hypothetical protein